MPTVTLPNATLHYDVSGQGDPTVLIHGSLVDGQTWNAVRPGLEQALLTLTYDRRGHGESVGPPRTHAVRDDAQDLAGLLETIDLFPVHLVAHSYGGAVALRLATDRPEMVRSLALHEPPFIGLLEEDPATVPEAERLWASLEDIRRLARDGAREAAVRSIVESLTTEDDPWSRLSPEVRRTLSAHLGRWEEEMGDPEASRPSPEILADLLIPVLLTSGERSPPFLRRIVERMSTHLRNATVREIAGAGHVPHVSDPDLFVAFIYGFLVERNVPVT
ncbi:MAG TPA: alpha/beta hydrolase [Thermoplasmata archaeon]|nr:alpha/beta hydrolase [Thermoplasmata archaeon]